MVEKYLGNETAADIFVSAMISRVVTEKEAENLVSIMKKEAQNGGGESSLLSFFKNIGKPIARLWSTGTGALKSVPPALGWIAATGATGGVLGTYLYDILKERLSHEDPEADFNSKVEALYRGKTKEIEDAQWMDKVRSMKDRLKRDYKKMSTEEYRKAYSELVAALDERA